MEKNYRTNQISETATKNIKSEKQRQNRLNVSRSEDQSNLSSGQRIKQIREPLFGMSHGHTSRCYSAGMAQYTWEQMVYRYFAYFAYYRCRTLSYCAHQAKSSKICSCKFPAASERLSQPRLLKPALVPDATSFREHKSQYLLLHRLILGHCFRMGSCRSEGMLPRDARETRLP